MTAVHSSRATASHDPVGSRDGLLAEQDRSKVVRHAKHVTFPMAELEVMRSRQAILAAAVLRPRGP